jgi:hypothetical protein
MYSDTVTFLKTKRFKELQEIQKTEMSGIIEWLDKAIKKQL